MYPRNNGITVRSQEKESGSKSKLMMDIHGTVAIGTL